MKKYIFLLLACSGTLFGVSKKMPKTKLSDLKVRYNQLRKNPIKNEAKIRDIIRQVRPVDEAWAQDAATRLNFIVNQSKGGGIRKREIEEPVIPAILPGVPTPEEYREKPEPETASSREEAYERAPETLPDFPAAEIPAYEPPVYEGEEEAPPAYEASLKKHAPRSSHKVAHSTRKVARKTA